MLVGWMSLPLWYLLNLSVSFTHLFLISFWMMVLQFVGGISKWRIQLFLYHDVAEISLFCYSSIFQLLIPFVDCNWFQRLYQIWKSFKDLKKLPFCFHFFTQCSASSFFWTVLIRNRIDDICLDVLDNSN